MSLMSSSTHMEMSARQLRDNLEMAFNKLDTNQDGVLTLEEFVDSCLKVSYAGNNKIKLEYVLILL